MKTNEAVKPQESLTSIIRDAVMLLAVVGLLCLMFVAAWREHYDAAIFLLLIVWYYDWQRAHKGE